MTILKLHSVARSFDAKAVLKGVDLELNKGSVMGLLGANGSGKTTLLHIAVGLLKVDAGQAELLGQSSWDMPVDVKQRIGFVAQKQDTFEWMNGAQLLKHLGAFYQNWDQSLVNQLLADWQLDTNQKITKMSEGQKQKLAIIQAMGHKPDVLILDEPVASLDPAARRDFIKQLIDLNAEQGTSILFSTHITSDIERVAAEVAMLKDGQITFQGGLDELKERVVRLHLSHPDGLGNLQLPNALHSEGDQQRQRLVLDHYTPDVQAQLQQQGAEVRVETLNLEEIYLELNR